MNLRFTALYIALIVTVNYAFSIVPVVELPGGTQWPPVALLVGFVFVVRDFAQREIGHKVLLAMIVGVVISYYMADPFVAVASAAAFLVSELADWAIYTFTKRPLSERILFSSMVGAPIDSAVFLGLLGFASPLGIALMSASKLVGALIVWKMIRAREQRETISA